MEAMTITKPAITGDAWALRIPILLTNGPICDGVLLTNDGTFLGKIVGETVQPITDKQGRLIEVRDPYWFTRAERF